MTDPSSALEHWARTTPQALALAWSEGHWSYEELGRQVADRSAHLSALGALAGSVVALSFRDGPDYTADLLSLWRSGAVVAPLPRGATARDVDQVDQLFRPGFRLDAEGDLQGIRGAGEVMRFDEAAGVSALVRTSGTSGAPKGVVLGHGAFGWSAEASKKRLGLSADDRWGVVLSAGHVGALGTVVRAVHLGASLWVGDGFEARALAQAIHEGDVTHVSVVPAMVSALLDQGLSGPIETLRCILVGGAHMPATLLARTADRSLPVALTWGLTEATAQVATATVELVAQNPGTVGLPLDGVDVDVDPEGRLRVRGPTMALGVVSGPGAEASPLPLDRDGWFRTEDLGSMDDAGRVWIEGRADDMIVSGGVNVSPREVEDVLATAEGVKDVAVLGIPDDRWGQVVVAVVVPEAGAQFSAEELDAHLGSHCRAHLTRSKCPTHIVFVDELPRTASGKVAKHLIPKLLNLGPGSREMPGVPPDAESP